MQAKDMKVGKLYRIKKYERKKDKREGSRFTDASTKLKSSMSTSGRFTPGNQPRFLLNTRLGGP
jgi:hypothetical protein